VDQVSVVWATRTAEIGELAATTTGAPPIRNALEGGGLADLRVEAKLRAYFPPAVVAAWMSYQLRFAGIKLIAFTASPLGRRLTSANASDIGRLVRGLALAPADEQEALRLLTGRGYSRDTQFQALTNLSRQVVQWHWAMVDQILDADLAGFSTTRRDLLRDLLP
jgi:hypothetical protein